MHVGQGTTLDDACACIGYKLGVLCFVVASLMVDLAFHQVLFLSTLTRHYDILTVFLCLYHSLIQFLIDLPFYYICCSFVELSALNYSTCIFSCYL